MNDYDDIENEEELNNNQNNNQNNNSLLDNVRDARNRVNNINNKLNLPKKGNFNNLNQRPNTNPGKNILNKNNSIKKPEKESLTNSKNANNGKLGEQLKKNGVRKAAEVMMPGGKVAAAAEKAGEVANKAKNKKEENKENKEKDNKNNSSNGNNTKEKNNDKSNNNDNNKSNPISNAKDSIENKLNPLNSLMKGDGLSTIKLLKFIPGPAVPILLIAGVIIGVVLIVVLVTTVISASANETADNDAKASSTCGEFDMYNTTLSEEDFVSKMNAYASKSNSAGFKTFSDNASTIYEIANQNKINPEVVVVRAIAEGFSPGGSSNNYWGIGCTNTGGGKDCKTYSSFDQGVLAYINILIGYNVDSLFDVFNVKHYSYIGSNWFSPGSAGKGGCYYLPYTKTYMSDSRYSEVKASCDSKTEIKTNDEDQEAFSHYQMEAMNKYRKEVFEIEPETCDDEEGTSDSSMVSGSGKGAEVAKYAVATFDSFGYSQGNRMGSNQVDCSSMVYRAWKHFGVKLGDTDYAPTANSIRSWCERTGKTISESDLQAGDLLLRSGHVEMYIGNGQKFGAHGTNNGKTPWADQVSVGKYNSGYFTSFCRPTK